MFGKGSGSSDDDFDFNDGDELFPLDDPMSGGSETPPKGLKGYLKNVVGSVKNASIKLGKMYFPETTEFIDDMVEGEKEGSDQSVSKVIAAKLQQAKKTAKDAYTGTVDIGKEIIDDSIKAAKTGKFWKSQEEEDNEMFGDMFGDMDMGFGDDDFDMGDSGDYGSDGDDYGTDDDEDYTPSGEEKAVIRQTKATVLSAKYQANATLRAAKRQASITMSSAQATIRHDTALFGQSIQVSQEQHRQKLVVMRNIAVNVGKIIKQNQLSLKAQMEYSLKSLAFAQDTAGIVKNIRDAQYKLVKATTGEDKEKEVDKGKLHKIFGDKFNMGAYVNNMISNFGNNNDITSMIGMAKEALGSMGDMMDPKKMIKSMIYEGILKGVGDSIFSTNTRKQFARFDQQMKGLPLALNNMLGRVGNNGLGILDKLETNGGKLSGAFRWINERVKEVASAAHIDDGTVYTSGKYEVGNYKEVHPFDKQAHTALTYVIPRQLAKISAGINNQKEEFFNYSTGKFETLQNVKDKITNEIEASYEYLDNVDILNRYTNFNRNDNNQFIFDKMEGDKYGNIAAKNLQTFDDQNSINEMLDEKYPLWAKQMFRNLADNNTRENGALDIRNVYEFKVRLANNDLDWLFNKLDIPKGQKEGQEDAIKKYIGFKFLNGLIEMNKKKPDEYLKLIAAVNDYNISAKSDIYLKYEREYGEQGLVDIYKSAIRNEAIKQKIRKLNSRIENENKRHAKELESITKLTGEEGAFAKRTLYAENVKNKENLAKFAKERKELNDELRGTSANAEINADSDIKATDTFDNYGLHNATTNGIVKNIFLLFIKGIRTYPQFRYNPNTGIYYKITPKHLGASGEYTKYLKDADKKFNLQKGEDLQKKEAALQDAKDAAETAISLKNSKYGNDDDEETWLTKKLTDKFSWYGKLHKRVNAVLKAPAEVGSYILARNAYGTDVDDEKLDQTVQLKEIEQNFTKDKDKNDAAYLNTMKDFATNTRRQKGLSEDQVKLAKEYVELIEGANKITDPQEYQKKINELRKKIDDDALLGVSVKNEIGKMIKKEQEDYLINNGDEQTKRVIQIVRKASDITEKIKTGFYDTKDKFDKQLEKYSKIWHEENAAKGPIEALLTMKREAEKELEEAKNDPDPTKKDAALASVRLVENMFRDYKNKYPLDLADEAMQKLKDFTIDKVGDIKDKGQDLLKLIKDNGEEWVNERIKLADETGSVTKYGGKLVTTNTSSTTQQTTTDGTTPASDEENKTANDGTIRRGGGRTRKHNRRNKTRKRAIDLIDSTSKDAVEEASDAIADFVNGVSGEKVIETSEDKEKEAEAVVGAKLNTEANKPANTEEQTEEEKEKAILAENKTVVETMVKDIKDKTNNGGKDYKNALKKLRNLVRESLGNVLSNINLAQKGEKTRYTLLDMIVDTQDTDLIAKIKSKSDPLAKLDTIIDSQNELIKKYKPQLINWKNTHPVLYAAFIKRDMDSVKGALKDTVNKYKEKLSASGAKILEPFIRRIFMKELYDIKGPNGKTLKDELADQKYLGFLTELNKEQDIDKRIELLLGYESETLNPYKAEIQKKREEFKAKRGDGKFGSAFDIVLGDRMEKYSKKAAEYANRGLDKIIDKFFSHKILNIQNDEGEKLKDVLKLRENRSLFKELKNEKDVSKKFELLLNSDNPKIQSFEKLIEDEKSKFDAAKARKRGGSLEELASNGLAKITDKASEWADKMIEKFTGKAKVKAEIHECKEEIKRIKNDDSYTEEEKKKLIKEQKEKIENIIAEAADNGVDKGKEKAKGLFGKIKGFFGKKHSAEELAESGKGFFAKMKDKFLGTKAGKRLQYKLDEYKETLGNIPEAMEILKDPNLTEEEKATKLQELAEKLGNTRLGQRREAENESFKERVGGLKNKITGLFKKKGTTDQSDDLYKRLDPTGEYTKKEIDEAIQNANQNNLTIPEYLELYIKPKKNKGANGDKSVIKKLQEKLKSGATGILTGAAGLGAAVSERFSGVHGSHGQEGTLMDQKLDRQEQREEEEREEQRNWRESIHDLIFGIRKDGLDLSDDAVDKLSDANAENTGGFLDSILGFFGLGGTGAGAGGLGSRLLSKTRWGKKLLGLRGGFNGAKGLLKGGAEGAAKKGGILKGAFKGARRALSRGEGLKGAAKGFFKSGTGAMKGTKAGKLFRIARGGIRGALNITKGALHIGGKGAVLAGKGAVAGAKGAVTVAKGAATVAKTGGGIIKTAIDLVKKIITGIFKNPTIQKLTGKTFAGPIIKAITDGITKFGGNLIGRLTGFVSGATASFGTTMLIGAAAGFVKGMADAKKTFHLGVGANPTMSMRLMCGAAAAVDGALMGIPGLIAKLFKKNSVAEWFYELVGPASEKEAINRYQKYNNMRAKVFGITDPQKLIAYENHNLLDKTGRVLLQVVTLGLADSNAQKEADLLGFKSVEIFKYWKDNKYKPLDDMRQTTASSMGVKLSDVEDLKQFTALNEKKQEQKTNDKGEPVEDIKPMTDEQRNEEEMRAVALQQEYRKNYLTKARDWVIENKLAWLTTDITPEQFEKKTGIKSKERLSVGGKLKKGLKTGAKIAAIAAVGGPVGLGIYVGFKLLKNMLDKHDHKHDGVKDLDSVVNGKKVEGIGWKIARGIVNLPGAIKNTVSKGVKTALNLGKKAVNAIGNFVDKAKQGIKNAINDGRKKIVTQWTTAINKFFVDVFKKANVIKDFAKRVKKIISKLMKSVEKYILNNPDNYSKFNATALGPNTSLSISCGSNFSKIVKNYNKMNNNDIREVFGIEIPDEIIDDKIRCAAATMRAIELIDPSGWIDDASCNEFRKTARLMIYEAIMNNSNIEDNNEYAKFRAEYAKILGVDLQMLDAWEKETGNKSTFAKGVEAVGGFFKKLFRIGNDPDQKYCTMLGFEHPDIYRFWLKEKYNKLKKLGKKVASRFGNYDILMDEFTDDPELQIRFFNAYLTEAKKFVSQNGVDWLTSKTTYEEFMKRKKTKTLFVKNGYNNAQKTDAKKRKEEAKEQKKKGELGTIENKNGTIKDTDSTGTKNYNNVDDWSTSVSLKGDSKIIAEDLKKRYNYTEKESAIISQGTAAIHTWMDDTDPTFRQNPQAPKMKNSNQVDVNPDGGEKGGPGIAAASISGDQFGHQILYRTKKTGEAKLEHRPRTRDLVKPANESYDLSGKTPKPILMNSIASDFAKEFGDELNEKLNILREIQEENVRYHGVAEEFFGGMLALVSQIAAKSGNKETSSEIDMLIQKIARR